MTEAAGHMDEALSAAAKKTKKPCKTWVKALTKVTMQGLVFDLIVEYF